MDNEIFYADKNKGVGSMTYHKQLGVGKIVKIEDDTVEVSYLLYAPNLITKRKDIELIGITDEERQQISILFASIYDRNCNE